jgi:hypothetical protein
MCLVEPAAFCEQAHRVLSRGRVCDVEINRVRPNVGGVNYVSVDIVKITKL